MLPEEAGYVVWLEAPYGYGKSVLASQWAATLEGEGWRVLWLSLEGRDVKAELTELLNLPDFVPWGVVRDQLWKTSTLLVLEDVNGEEELDPLLKEVRGLLLLASRAGLSYANLPRLTTSGYLVRLSAGQLAFNESEAKELFRDSDEASQMWQQTGGWSLPLHFASLTGETPEHGALLKGMRASLSLSAWQEALFLAALPYLPQDAATVETADLVQAGFVQALEQNYRLHPLIAETMTRVYKEDLKQTVISQGARLNPGLRAEVYASVNYKKGLAQLLEDGGAALFARTPSKFLAWHAAVPAPVSATRRAHVAAAQFLRNQGAAGLDNVQQVYADKSVSADLKLFALTKSLHYLSYTHHPDKARQCLAQGHSLFTRASPFNRVSFLNQEAGYYRETGAAQQAQASYQAAMRGLKDINDHPEKIDLQLNLSVNWTLFCWEHLGDCMSGTETLVALDHAVNLVPGDPRQLSVDLNLAVYYTRLGNYEAALGRVNRHEHSDSVYGLWWQMLKAYLEQDLSTFQHLNEQARKWEFKAFAERVSALWLRTLRRLGVKENAAKAFALRDSLSAGPHTCIEYSYFEHARGNTAAALALLEAGRNGGKFLDRDHQLVWWAAHYTLTKQESSLDTLLDLSLGARPAFAVFAYSAKRPAQTPPRTNPGLRLKRGACLRLGRSR